MKTFKKRVELNQKKHSYTGNIITYYGKAPKSWKSTEPDMFVSISDCHSTIRLHSDGGGEKAQKAFLAKVGKLKKAITEYENFLKNRIK